MSDVTPLLRRSPLHSDESLPSLIYRHAALNFYDSPGTLNQLIWQGIRTKGTRLTRLRAESDLPIFGYSNVSQL
jgi:hypothetical protein